MDYEVGDEVLVKARIVQVGLDYSQIACVVQSFEGNIELEPDQVFIVLPMDIEKRTKRGSG